MQYLLLNADDKVRCSCYKHLQDKIKKKMVN